MSAHPLAPDRWRQPWWRPLAFVLGLAALVAPLYALGTQRYLPPELEQDRRSLAAMATGRVIVLGSSHGYDIVPKEVGLVGENFSHTGQDVFEMAQIARVVKGHAPYLDTVIFTLSYFTFALDNAAYLEAGVQARIGKRLDLYAAFPSLRFISGDGAAWLKGMLFPLITGDHWQRVFIRPRAGSRAPGAKLDDDDQIPDPAQEARSEESAESAESLTRHARQRCRSYKYLMANMRAHHPKLEEDAFDTLYDVVSELEAANIHVILVTPPYYEAYSKCFDRQRQALTRGNAREIVAKTGAEYIDAGNSAAFATSRELYTDSDHLNGEGQRTFSRWLKSQLAAR